MFGELSRRGFDAFLPSQRVKRRWSDRTKESDEPLFPGYLFCRFERAHYLHILEAPGVIQIVGTAHSPDPVSETEIAAIQTMVKSRLTLTPWPYLRTGQRVRIDGGPLAGVEGIVIRSEAANPRVVVSVTLLQRSVAAEIEREWIGAAV